MKVRRINGRQVIELGRASVETKGGGIVYPDGSGGLRNAAPGVVED